MSEQTINNSKCSNESIKAPDFKTAMALSVSHLSRNKDEVLDFTNTSVVVITAAGTIYGTACIDLEKESETSIPLSLMSALHKTAKKIVNPSVSTYVLTLKDATLITGNAPAQKFEYLFVYPEDIIAITLGQISNI